MDVTRLNFKEILPEVENAIKSASFITIDGEFTGLNNGPTTNAYDSPAQYYDKIRRGAMDFLLVQFGLCAFKYDESSQSFTHQAYNFYVFPRRSHVAAPDTRFLCQSSSIDFLASNGFDFNKLFNHGISYLTKKEHEELEAKLKVLQDSRKSSDSSPKGKIVVPMELSDQVHEICTKIEHFLHDNSTDINELEFPKLNSFVRKLIFQEVYSKFPNEKIILDTKILPDKKCILVARKGTTKEEFEKEKCLRENDDLQNAIGFSTVIRLLIKYESNLVGHNMFLDLCHIINRFCFDLPDDYITFKSAVNFIFPRIFDTKLICSQPPFRDLISNTVLGSLLEIVQKEPFKPIHSEASLSGRGYSCSDNKCHEAGYDAYITGLVFIALTTHLGSLSKPHTYPVLPTCSIMNKYVNKCFLRRLEEYSFIDLKGIEPQPDRSHVFHLSFPESWKTSDIAQLFHKYGPINIAWINGTSAFVALSRKDQKSNVISNFIMKRKQNNIRKDFKIITFEQYENEQFSSQIVQHTGIPKRKRTTSNESSSGGNVTKKHTKQLSNLSSSTTNHSLKTPSMKLSQNISNGNNNNNERWMFSLFVFSIAIFFIYYPNIFFSMKP